MAEEDAMLESTVALGYTCELGYEMPAAPSAEGRRACSFAGCKEREVVGGKAFPSCAKCRAAFYHSRECQKADWKKHKHICMRAGSYMRDEPYSKLATVSRLLRKVRMYMCPFACAHQAQIGDGFVLLQSPNTLDAFVLLDAAVDCKTGERHNRGVIMTYMTVAEFSEGPVKDDKVSGWMGLFVDEMTPRGTANPAPRHFPNTTQQHLATLPSDQESEKLALAVAPLNAAVEAADHDTQLVILTKFRCGHVSVVTTPLVPEKRVCNVMAADYVNRDTIQLNIEDAVC